jgi:hypothetical protein
LRAHIEVADRNFSPPLPELATRAQCTKRKIGLCDVYTALLFFFALSSASMNEEEKLAFIIYAELLKTTDLNDEQICAIDKNARKFLVVTEYGDYEVAVLAIKTLFFFGGLASKSFTFFRRDSECRN